MLTVYVLLCFIIAVVSTEVYIEDQYEYEKYDFVGNKPKFNNTFYSARLVNNIVKIDNGPIALLKCGYYPFDIRVTMENTSSYFTIGITKFTQKEMDCPLVSNFSIDMGNSRTRKNLYNVFKLQAIYHPYIVAETSIIVTNSPSSFIYNINGENHLIFNYAWSVALLVYFTLTMVLGVICLTVYIVRKFVRYEYYSVTNIIV